MNAKHPSPLTLFLALVGVAFLAGCQTPVKTEFKPETAFGAYKTFALMPLPQTGPVDDPGLMLRIAKPAQEATIEALTAKGYQAVDRGAADFVVNLRGQSLPRVQVSDWGYTMPVMTRYGTVPVEVRPPDVRTYDERTLTIEIFDNKSHDLVWTGWMTKQSSGKVNIDRLKEAIQRILARFPPAPGETR